MNVKGAGAPMEKDGQLGKLLLAFAQKYIWWKNPAESALFPDRIVAQVMELGFDAVLIADGHTCSDTPLLTARQIVAHHNATLAGPFCRVVQAQDWSFQDPCAD